MAGTEADRKRSPRPLDGEALRALAIRYVARYATSTGKLRDYLRRKLAERGWSGEGAPPVDEVIARCVAAGWIDDAAYARARASTLARAGYGERRRDLALRAAGLDPGHRAAAQHALETEAAADGDGDPAWRSALAYARRRRLGPFAKATPGPEERRRATAALLRAGHDYGIARRIAGMMPGADPEQADIGADM